MAYLFEQYHLKDIDREAFFEIRDDMSDRKAIEEVIVRRGYAPHGFTPQPGEHWLDLGANVGAFSVWAGLHGATVTAWEPEPECYRMAKANISLNNLRDQVELRPAGVWPVDRPAEMMLSVNGHNGNVWRSSLLKSWRGGTEVIVDVEPLEPFWNPDVCVKMDVEGSELAILRSLGSKRVKKLVFEYSFDILPDMQDFKDVMANLESVYDNVRGGPGTARLAEPRWIARGPSNGVNVYCW